MVSKLGGTGTRTGGICKLGEAHRDRAAWYEGKGDKEEISMSRRLDYADAQRKDREAAEASAGYEAFVQAEQAKADALYRADQARADAGLRVDQARADARARLDGVRGVALRRGEVDVRAYTVSGTQNGLAAPSSGGQGLFASLRNRVEQAASVVQRGISPAVSGGLSPVVRSPGVVPSSRSVDAPPPAGRAEIPDRREARADFGRGSAARGSDRSGSQ